MARARVISLASGSSGNALVIDAGETRLLVDAGISARRLDRGLAEFGVSPASLDAVLITHEHTDHVSGLHVFGRRHRIPCYLTAGTARATPGLAGLPHHIIGRADTFGVGRATVTAFPVQHDSTDPVGYVVEVADVTIAVFTDLGSPEPHLHEPLERADLIVLEANHDLDRLWGGGYPWHLKRRIAGQNGHLCNDDCGDLLAAAIDDTRARAVWLAHLSPENNDAATAAASVAARVDGRALALTVLPRFTAGPIWES